MAMLVITRGYLFHGRRAWLDIGVLWPGEGRQPAHGRGGWDEKPMAWH